MRPLRASVRALAAALALASIGAALEPDDGIDGFLATAQRETVRAARGLALDDRDTSLDALADATFAAVQARNAAIASPDPSLTDRVRARLLGKIETFQLKLGEATDAVEDEALAAAAAAKSLQKAAAAGAKARKLVPDALLQAFDAVPAGNGFAKAGRRVTVRLLPGAGGLPPGVPAATVANDGPGVAFEAAVEVLTPSTLRLVAGPDGGGATLTIDFGGDTRTLRLCNLGPRGALGRTPPWGDSGTAPTTLTYPETVVQWRVGDAITTLVPTVTGGHPAEFVFSAGPALPDGIVLDPVTGVISGTPTAEQAATEHGIRATNLHGFAGALLNVEVTPALPPGLEHLEPGFEAERLHDALAVPVKMAMAPDGRLFFNELATGNVRVISAAGALVEDPVATVTVQAGGERGLLGLALAPDFGTSGHLFVYAIVPAEDPKPIRGQVIRFTVVGDSGTDPQVVLDDLPSGDLQNAGDLQFAPDGTLFLSVGDTGTPALAQTDGARAGRILRYDAAGGIPADNPIAGDPEWCRGLRNPFDMAFHAGTGGLFCTENGPTANDELELVLEGRNYGWETLPQGFPLNLVGPRIRLWPTVIVPTGLAFHTGTGFGAEYADNLFLGAYDDAEIRRLVLSGPVLSDLDAELLFARFDDAGSVANKPLDLLVAPDGSLLVSTFSSIWRFRKFTP